MPTHQCSLCPKRFSRSTHLREHFRSHTGERPYVCTVDENCGKAFARLYDRNQHQKIHGAGMHVCLRQQGSQQLGCGKAFHRKEDLKRHLRRAGASACGFSWSDIALENASPIHLPSTVASDQSNDTQGLTVTASSQHSNSTIGSQRTVGGENATLTRTHDEGLSVASRPCALVADSTSAQHLRPSTCNPQSLVGSENSQSAITVDSNVSTLESWEQQAIQRVKIIWAETAPEWSKHSAGWHVGELDQPPEVMELAFDRATRERLLSIDAKAPNPWLRLVWPLYCDQARNSGLKKALSYAMGLLVSFNNDTVNFVEMKRIFYWSMANLQLLDTHEFDSAPVALLATLVLLNLVNLWTDCAPTLMPERFLARMISSLIGREGPLAPKAIIAYHKRETISFLRTTFVSFQIVVWSFQQSLGQPNDPFNWRDAAEIFNGITSVENLEPVSGCGLELPALMLLELALDLDHHHDWDTVGLPNDLFVLKRSFIASNRFKTLEPCHFRALSALYIRTKELYDSMTQVCSEGRLATCLRLSKEIIDTIPAVPLSPCHALPYQIPLLMAGLCSGTLGGAEDQQHAVDLCNLLLRSLDERNVVDCLTILEITWDEYPLPSKDDLLYLWTKCFEVVHVQSPPPLIII